LSPLAWSAKDFLPVSSDNFLKVGILIAPHITWGCSPQTQSSDAPKSCPAARLNPWPLKDLSPHTAPWWWLPIFHPWGPRRRSANSSHLAPVIKMYFLAVPSTVLCTSGSFLHIHHSCWSFTAHSLLTRPPTTDLPRGSVQNSSKEFPSANFGLFFFIVVTYTLYYVILSVDLWY
jgi:hypothetical protein